MTKKLNSWFNQKIIKYSASIIFLSMVLVLIPVAINFLSINQVKAGPLQGPTQSGAPLDTVSSGGRWWQTVQQGGLAQVGQAYGGGEPRTVTMVVVDTIKIILGLLGILSVVIILYAGFKWMTAGGNEENVAAAKKILTAGLIGLVIILSAYIVANFVIYQIYGATSGTQFMNTQY